MKKIIVILACFIVLGCGIESGEKKEEKSSDAKAEVATSREAEYDYSSVPDNAEFVFVMSHNGNLEDYKHKGGILLKSFVESNSNGRIGIKIFPNGQLGSSLSESMDGLIQESFDITNTTGGVSNYWEPISVFDLPYFITSDRLAEAVFSDVEFIKELRDGALAATKNARLMVITNSGRFRNFATTKKQLKTVDDIKGLKFRTISSQVQQKLVSVLGGSPTGIPWGETYTALSTGVVDGTKNGIVDIINAKFQESVKFVLLDGHAYMAGFWWVNNNKFQSMPDDLKEVMVDGFDALSWFIREYNKYAEASSIEQFKAAGGTLFKPSNAELARFQEQAQEVEVWFKENVSDETLAWLERYKQVIDKQKAQLATIRNLEIN